MSNPGRRSGATRTLRWALKGLQVSAPPIQNVDCRSSAVPEDLCRDLSVEFAKLYSALVVLLFLSGDFAYANSTPSGRPNILLAIADDWGYPHASCYADPVVKTPTFDRLAREGVLFTHAFVSSPSCTPSRGALLAGQHFWRLRQGANLWSTMPADVAAYPDLLETAGYFVGHTRKGWGPGKLGERTRNPAGPQFADFEQFLAQRPKNTPFCFWFGSLDPHRPYEAGTGRASGMDLGKIKLPAAFPDATETRSDVADYYFEVERFDREVGELLAKLEAIGELDNTLVVMTGDHGMPFPRGKANLYDLGMRVPLAIRWGSTLKQPGRTLNELVLLPDLAPTFLAAAGLPAPAAMTGRSLLGPLTGDAKNDTPRDHVVFGRERHTPAQEAPLSGGYPMRGIRTQRYLYIRNFEPDRWPVGTPDYKRAFLDRAWLGDTDNGPTKEYIWLHRDEPAVKTFYELAFAKRPAEELYDLEADPDQQRNVADVGAYREAQQELSARLRAELAETGDPRVVGGGEEFDRYPYYGAVPQWPW
jgi:N-sulfoglucosamine sulfohydrolase